MPYTPPSQRSPATSRTNSPIISRTHSYTNMSSASATTQRPTPPRSASSTSYLHKQRRSPSFQAAGTNDANAHGTSGGVDIMSDADRARASSRNGSIRPSPPPSNDHLIPSGAITTPPDSSDDDERGRHIGNLRELEQALQHMNVKRDHSPSQDTTTKAPHTTPPPMTMARSLSAEARKIAHSRSSSEVMLSKHNMEPLITDTTISSTDDSDAEDDELRMKPPLLRKKSGELVRPALRPPSRRRPSSMPGTPTWSSKAVHFNENMEQVRHFLQVDRPIAVSVGSSPVETYDSETEYPFTEDTRNKTPEYEIKLANFPTSESYERQSSPVRVERIYLANDNQTLVGSIACANIAFNKFVVARFTLDYWKTTSEVVAEFNHDVRMQHKDDGHDRFNFTIKLADQANLESKTLLICVRYQVNGQEFWDNNNNMNYQVDFTKKTKQRETKQREPKRSKAGLGAIPRSRNSPGAPRQQRFMTSASSDDDFGHDSENQFEFGSREPTIRLKPKSKRVSHLQPAQAPTTQAGLAFSARYDFGASLSAALSTAQTALGARSGLPPNGTTANKGYFDRPAPGVKAHTTSATPVASMRPDTFSSEKPDLQSAEYNELIQKFCFFGTSSGKHSPVATSPPAKHSHGHGAIHHSLTNGSGSNQSSVISSPPFPAVTVPVDGANDVVHPQSSSSFLSHSTTPKPVTGSGLDDHIASQYGYNMSSGFSNQRSHTPTACV